MLLRLCKAPFLTPEHTHCCISAAIETVHVISADSISSVWNACEPAFGALTWALTGSQALDDCTCPTNTWLDAVNNHCVACTNSTSSAGTCAPRFVSNYWCKKASRDTVSSIRNFETNYVRADFTWEIHTFKLTRELRTCMMTCWIIHMHVCMWTKRCWCMPVLMWEFPLSTGSTSVEACMCNADFYKTSDGSCSACPESSTSLGGENSSLDPTYSKL